MRTSHKRNKKGSPGDWMERKTEGHRPFAAFALSSEAYNPEDVYDDFRQPRTDPFGTALKAIESGKAEVEDAWLFCGRWNEHGRLCREADKSGKPYRMLHVRGQKEFAEAMRFALNKEKDLKNRLESERAARRRQFRESNEFAFQSVSDAGSLMTADPNQFTEFTPLYNGPFNRQQYYDFFRGIAIAFEEWNHNPVAKRIVNILCQYSMGRGFKVQCHNDKLEDEWNQHVKNVDLYHKMRKFWCREYLVNGELLIDVETWMSIDSSTIYEIVTDIENPDQIYYYQQMYQSYVQTYAGQTVPGVPGSAQTITSKYFIRQIPYDRVVMVRTECLSNEKRGRSILYAIMGWCKRLKDLYNAQVVGEQLRSSFIFDDLIKGGDGDVSAHAQKYAYMPPPASVFAHNEGIERKPMAPMASVSPSRDGVGQEILAVIATAVGIPKEHLNVISMSGGSRATAIVGSEPFTKVIEDLQQDFEDLVLKLIEKWCDSRGIDFKQDDWQISFPSVTKDSTGDVLKNIAFTKDNGAITKRRAATMMATEMEIPNYDYDDEVAQGKSDDDTQLSLATQTPLPAARFGPSPNKNGNVPEDLDNPIHGNGKKAIIAQHKNL